MTPKILASPSGNLAGNLTTDLDLLFRFFAAVAMAAIDHNSRRYAGFCHTLGRCIDVFCIVIGITTAAENDRAIFVAGGWDDGRMTVLDGQQMIGRSVSTLHNLKAVLEFKMSRMGA